MDPSAQPPKHSLVLIVPGDLRTRTGGYGYDRRIVAGLCDRGWSVTVHEWDHSFPRPTSAALSHASHVLAAIPSGTTVLVDGLALGAAPAEIEREAARLRLVALVHHPLAAETGLERGTAEALARGERRALAAVRLIVVTSSATAVALETYGVSRERVVVVEPGTDRAPLARGSQSARLEMLCVAALIPRKGHDVLFNALATISQHNWHLACAGSLRRDPETVARLVAQLNTSGLRDRVTLADELDGEALAARYDVADLFVLPTLFEGYGMAVAEALARGLPVISTATGGISDLVGDEAGILVRSGDPVALASALSQVLTDKNLRARLARGARRVRDRLPGWDDAVSRMAEALIRVGEQRSEHYLSR